ncbi:MAG: hypothetical protein DRJ42_29445, partial [Deltaproteobacteria bacterium]
MVYRQPASDIVHERDDDPKRSLLTLGAAGSAGSRAADGSHGGTGGPGGDAGPAEGGQGGGSMSVRLRRHALDGDQMLALDGWLVVAGGERREVEREVEFDDGGLIYLDAHGGLGGAGGVGGSGGSGYRGSNGSDATRYSSGSDGGSGGRGGDGGDGSSGAAGGRGGRVEIAVSADDTHLLMLVRNDVRGGHGGAAGVNGAGGAGGPGGSGGSSYSWTTTESYQDSQGNSQTRTRHHSNPGGSRGHTGSSGYDGNARLTAGAEGADGVFRIAVHADGQVAHYEDRYRLRLLSFQHASANEDGVYEPDERVEVSGLMVLNFGGMPTPRNHDVCLSLESSGWVWPDEDDHLVLSKSLGAGEVAEVPGSLFFTVRDWRPNLPGEPFEAFDHILHGAVLPAAFRDFEGYHGPEDPQGAVHVRFPLEVSAIESLHALAPGEAARVLFEMRSVSTRAFGADGDVGRRVRFHLRSRESELGPEHASLRDGDGNPLPWDDGWLCPVPVIGAGEALPFEATLALTPDAPAYRSVTLRLSLEMERPRGGEVRPIQLREFEWRVARRYRRVEGCDLLLVTSHRTTREQLEAWERLAARLGLRMAVWDVSLEGHLALRQGRAESSLLEHVAGGTIAVLDAEIDSAAGPVRPHRLLDRDALFAMNEKDVSLAVFGGEAGDLDISRWLTPDDGARPSAHRDSPDALWKAVAGLRDLHGQGEVQVHEVTDVHHIGFWFEPPTEAILERRAISLSERLRHEYPNRRFVVTPRFLPEEVGSIGLAKRWKLGEIEVRATLEAARGHLVHVGGRLGQALPEDIEGPHFTQALLLARDFEEKLARLGAVLAEGGDPWPEARAILVDLVNEQLAILASPWRRGLSAADCERAQPLLRTLRDRGAQLSASSPEAEPILIEIAARVRYFASAQPRLWEWLLMPLRRAPTTSRVTNGLVDEWLENVFALASTEGDDHREESKARMKHARKLVAERVDVLAGEERAKAEEALGPLDSRAHSRLIMREPIEWEGVTTDAEVFESAADRVQTPSQLAALREVDARDDAMRQRVFDAHGEARAQLLVTRRVEAVERVQELEEEEE